MSYLLFGVVVFLSYLLYHSKKENQYLKHLLSEDEEVQEDEGIEVGELSDEENDIYAKSAEQVRILCKLAECHIENLEDEYESSKLNERMDKAIIMAKEIPDEFYSLSALGFVAKLAHDAGLLERKDAILGEINDPLVLEMVQSIMEK